MSQESIENIQESANVHTNDRAGSAPQGKLLPGAAAGAIAAVIAAMLWAAVTMLSGYELGLIAIAVGYGVAFGVRSVGQGSTPVFAYTGAGLALLGCLLGKVLTFIGFFAREMQTGYFEALAGFDFSTLPGLMQETFNPMDLLFYGIAIYEGYRLSRVQA